MEAMKGGGRVGVGEEQEMGDGMQCSDHPYRNNPGGICAFCLQEKLGKLVSSSFPLPIPIPIPPPPSTSSSSSPSFRSQVAAPTLTTATSPPAPSSNHHQFYPRRSRLPFLLPIKKNTKKPPTSDILLKRSKSTATPRRNHSFLHTDVQDFSPRKRNGFWSFLYLSSKSSKKLNNNNNTPNMVSAPGTATTSANLKDKCCSHILVQQDNTTSPNAFDRKVSRSRSVGCGSRSFSGDFFERISTGFGDCTLRRVESQREGKPKGTSIAAASATAVNHHHNHHHCIKERVRCGGLFSGFMMTSSSSSSSSSSYWVSSSADDAAAAAAVNGKTAPLSHNRGKSWGWAFASPMRAFSIKPSSNRRDINIIRDANDKNPTPNLSAIPSLLAVRA